MNYCNDYQHVISPTVAEHNRILRERIGVVKCRCGQVSQTLLFSPSYACSFEDFD